MSVPIRFFRDSNQAWETYRLLGNHNIKTYVREREVPRGGDDDRTTIGYDLLVLRDDDAENARKILNYEFGQEWGEEAA